MPIITKRETQKSASGGRIFPFEIRLFREHERGRKKARQRRDWIQRGRLQQREKKMRWMDDEEKRAPAAV